jgi:hypothetical protein
MISHINVVIKSLLHYQFFFDLYDSDESGQAKYYKLLSMDGCNILMLIKMPPPHLIMTILFQCV